jgi:integrase
MRLKITTRFSKIGTWFVDGRDPNGQRVRHSLQTKDASRAEEKRAHLEKQLWDIHMYGPGVVMTFEEAALAYANDGGEARYLVKISEQLHGVTLARITPQVIRAAAKKALSGRAASTINRQGIVPARAVINYAHSQGWCAPVKVAKFPETKPKKKAVGDDYLTALKPYLDDRVFACVLFIHTTGRRIGEALALKPEDVNLHTGRVTIDRTKNGEAATAKLIPPVIDILKNLPPRNGFVFGYVTYSGFRNALQQACLKAGVEYLGSHQLGRHSFATNLHENEGWTSKAIADAGGWKTVRLVEDTYIHTNEAADRATGLLGKNWASALKVVK